MMSTELIRYDEMCRAIDAAHNVDEVKDIRDKAVALEAYFRQAKNPEPERRACEIRLRAERKAGALLKVMDKGKGAADGTPGPGRGHKTVGNGGRKFSEYRQALKENEIPDRTASRWQQLAEVPEDQFEEGLAAPEKPSTTGIINQQKSEQQEPMDRKALWLWGRLRDFEREGILDESFETLVGKMTEGMQADVHRLSATVATWLSSIQVGDVNV